MTDLDRVNSSFVYFQIRRTGIKPLTSFLIAWKRVSLCELMSIQNTFPWPPFVCSPHLLRAEAG